MTAILAFIAASTAQVTWVDDEPKAVLAILQSASPTDQDWQRLWQTDGYKRLKQREAGMNRPFTDDDFKTFVLSPELKAQTQDLANTLKSWAKTNFEEAARQDAVYLPASAHIRAKIYPLIKPLHNSFVWDTEKDPAIMLYLNPTESQERFRRTIVHEMHHIGYASCCPSDEFKKWCNTLTPGVQKAWNWVSAFGEGYAVLAAAGSIEADPMAPFEPDVKEAWNHGMSHVQEDMNAVGNFLKLVATDTITGDDITQRASAFFGVQGPWYTLGWIQATTIERAFGREKLLECYTNPRKLFPTYNAAITKLAANYPKWPYELMKDLDPDAVPYD